MLEDTALRVGDTHLELMIIPLIEILRLNEVPKSSSQPALALIYLASLHDLFSSAQRCTRYLAKL